MAGYKYGGTQPAPKSPRTICGTEKGLWRHRYNNESYCPECREFANTQRLANYHANKHKPPSSKRLESIAKLEKAQKLFAAGASQLEVARKTGLSRSTLRRHMPGQCWTYKQAAEHGNALRRAS